MVSKYNPYIHIVTIMMYNNRSLQYSGASRIGYSIYNSDNGNSTENEEPRLLHGDTDICTTSLAFSLYQESSLLHFVLDCNSKEELQKHFENESTQYSLRTWEECIEYVCKKQKVEFLDVLLEQNSRMIEVMWNVSIKHMYEEVLEHFLKNVKTVAEIKFVDVHHLVKTIYTKIQSIHSNHPEQFESIEAIQSIKCVTSDICLAHTTIGGMTRTLFQTEFLESCKSGFLNVSKWFYYICKKHDYDILTVNAEEFLTSCCKYTSLYQMKWFRSIIPESSLPIMPSHVVICLKNPLNADTYEILTFLLDACKEKMKDADWTTIFESVLFYSTYPILRSFTNYEEHGEEVRLQIVKDILKHRPDIELEQATMYRLIMTPFSNNLRVLQFLYEVYQARGCDFEWSTYEHSEIYQRFSRCVSAGDVGTAKFILDVCQLVTYRKVFDNVFKTVCYNAMSGTQELRTHYFDCAVWISSFAPDTYYLEYDESTSKITAYEFRKVYNLERGIFAHDVCTEIGKCSICEETQSNVITTCQHTFCKECIIHWLSTYNKSCPLCRNKQYIRNLRQIVSVENATEKELSLSFDSDTDNMSQISESSIESQDSDDTSASEM